METTHLESGRHGRPSELEQSIQTLFSDDHSRLQRLLAETLALAGGPRSGEFRESWNQFELGLLTHLHAEEVHLFRAFRHAHPEQAQSLMTDHERLRARLTDLSIALDLHCLSDHQVSELGDELRAHAAREEALLYPWAARHLQNVVGIEVGLALAAGRVKASGASRETWQIDAARSTLTFSLRHALIAEIAGRFKRWGGTLVTDPERPTESHASVWVDLASIDTGDQDRDRQACSAQFLDVEQHPEARFVSARIRLPDDGNPIIEGRLELHGIAREGTFEIVDRRQTTDADGTERAIYLMRGEVDRRDFELRWHTELDPRALAVGARVSVEARVEAVRRPA